MLVEQRQHLLLIAEDDEARIGTAFQHQRGAGDDDGGTVIPAHRIERDCNRSCQWSSGVSRKWPTFDAGRLIEHGPEKWNPVFGEAPARSRAKTAIRVRPHRSML